MSPSRPSSRRRAGASGPLEPVLAALARHPLLAPHLSGTDGGDRGDGRAREVGAGSVRDAGGTTATSPGPSGGTRPGLGGLWGASAAAVAALWARGTGRGRVVVVVPSPEGAESALLDLSTLAPDLPAVLLPPSEEELAVGPEVRANRSERLVALASLDDPADGVLVVPGPVLLEELPSPAGDDVVVEKGGRLDRDRLLASLAEAGFLRVPLVAAPGEVSVRGDILDVYPWAAEAPVRIELFDDEVEDLRVFEVDSQRSIEHLDVVRLRLASGEGTRRRLEELLPEDAHVLVIDPARLHDRLAETAFETETTPRQVERRLAALRRHPGAELHPIDIGREDTDLSLLAVGGDPRPPEVVLDAWAAEGRHVTVLCDGEGDRDRLASVLESRGLPPGRVHLATGRLSAGFALPGSGPAVVHHHELVGRRAVRRRRPARTVATRALDSLAELHPGDHVVHLLHGVARFGGMTRLAREQGEEDFLVLEFAERTKLYVPASRIDLVERFIGGDVEGPRLDRLGGRTWSRKKDKVARAVQDLAAELLALSAARASGTGFAHNGDETLLARFEASFAYDDTPDQHAAWDDVRRDMQRPHPMDRLVVGDVGFGKTEIAVRAAYLAVLSGKQVAVLVPTTILAEQHFETFRQRMAEEPVRVEALSRLRADAHAREVVADLAAGKVDVVIGTHRLLGSDIRFRDLGLLVVDEEQRFGVSHKEKLKALRTDVDVLTLSATPIPRTLHMAMSGLRDISNIRTPPPGRRPVVTRVTYDGDETVRAAVRHELNRGGQVFVLHNRVQTLDRVLERIRALVPRGRSAAAHGQMSARQLQHVVEDFARGDIDVLVCTTIVESGIDIPRANTIVVTDAQRYGLADMHQLRGRVGRENRQAYAYFLVPPGRLGESAQRRLKAIEEFSSLDAGLPIALRDLELRGAGNLLGAEQSGHIMAVGYDTYCRLLRNAVAAARGRAPEDEPGELEVDLGLTAFLPADYVPDETTRMGVLRRLAAAGRRRLEAIESELVDRFGTPPPPARELLELFRLRRHLRLAGVASLAADAMNGALVQIRDPDAFESRHPFRPEEMNLISPTELRIPWPPQAGTPRARLRWLLDAFESRPPAARRRAEAGAG